MDELLQSLQNIEFREKMRGYHPDDVDQFVDQALAAVEGLTRKIEDLEARLARGGGGGGGGAAAAPSASTTELDETLKKTLLRAQQFADQIAKEAQEEANKLREDAHESAQRMVAEAVEDARRTATEAQQQMRVDVSKLEAARTQLQADVEALGSHLEHERDNLRNTLQSALDALEKGIDNRRPEPAVRTVDVPPEPASGGRFARGGAPAEVDDEPIPEPSTNLPWADSKDEDEEDSDDFKTPGPITSSTPSYSDPAYEEIDDDSYMEELRRAVSDPTPLGPREDEDGAPVDSAAASPIFTTSSADAYMPPTAKPEGDDDGFTSEFSQDDFFASEDDDDEGGPSSRLRRRR